mmetsp:Transcript_16592/g.27312  ORF Transcript_16592/g.27312 Transcript_16592/m.27312 type:complete len:99 (-) Transcript_16592:62-358(-)
MQRSYLEDEHENAFPEGDTTKWLQSWRIEDLSDKCPQQENDFDCGIFHLLNLCLLVNEGGISLESAIFAGIHKHKYKRSEKNSRILSALGSQLQSSRS